MRILSHVVILNNSQAKKAWNDYTKAYQRLTKDIKQMESTLDALRNEAETSEEVPTIDTSEFESEVTEAQESLEEVKTKETQIAQEIEDLRPAIDEAKRRLDEESTRNDRIMNEIDKEEAMLEEIVQVSAVLCLWMIVGMMCLSFVATHALY